MNELDPSYKPPFPDGESYEAYSEERRRIADEFIAKDAAESHSPVVPKSTDPELPGLNAAYWASDEHQRKVIAAHRQIQTRK